MAFMQRAELIIDGKTIQYPDLDMEFEVNFKDDSEGNTGYCRIYNLANSTVNMFEEDKHVTLKAGYEGDIGTLLPGVIESFHTRYEQVDRETELILGDATDNWLNATVNRTWKEDKTGQEVAEDIIGLTRLDLGEFSPKDDITYEKGKKFATTCKKALEEIATDIDSKLHVRRGRIYFITPEEGVEEVVLLNSDTGLISSPEPGTKDGKKIWDVQSLLNYRIWADSIVRIESKTITGLYRVIDGQHVLSGNDFLTEMEVEKYGA